MGLLSLEQNTTLVHLDFAVYGLLVAGAAALSLGLLPAGQAAEALAWAAAGAAAWTLAEYLLHRFVLHGLQPFRRWHALHHQQPTALIATPTLLTVALFGALVVAPAWWLLPLWRASAFVSGVLAAYLAYIAAHHAVHHSHGRSAWLRHHKRWHALHHHVGVPACYGVSLRLWDHVFRSVPARAVPPAVRQRTDSAALPP